MGTLDKYKKQAEEGFKTYVKKMEVSSNPKAIIQSALLEDPVYVQWILKNMVPFEYVFKLTSDEWELLLNETNKPVETLLYAIFESRERSRFESTILPEKYKEQYNEESPFYQKVENSQKVTSQRTIITKMRKLQDERAITPYSWKLPEHEILTGKNYPQMSKGEFTLKFENDQLALEGAIESGRRAGKWKHWYPTGQLMAEGTYRSAEKHGEWIFYYSSGEKLSEGPYHENSKHGEWKEYTKEGAVNLVKYERGKAA